jgi:hypothetical protein
MRLALTATCITTLATLLATEARADTTVSTATTAPLQTSTAGNITITADGSIAPASGTAVTINSNNTVSNAGKITFTGVNNAAGIVATGGLTSSITNTGTISLDETYTRTDANGDGVLDGPYAQGTNRYAIRIDGTAPFVGAINNSGIITVDGNNSAGIYVSPAVTGNFSSTGAGSITVTGNNSYGIRLGEVTGKVLVSNAIGVLGGGAVGLALTDDVTGQVVVHGSATTTGYSSISLPTDITKLTPEDVQQSGSAMLVQGSISGGLLLAAAPTDTTNTTIDADNDGVADATESTSSLLTYGAAPSLMIGSAANPITLGVFGGNTNGLIVNGSVAGVGVYSGVGATGAQIGGLGGTVTINGGISVGGQITGASNGGAAYGLHLGAGTTTPTLTVSGGIIAGASATAGGTATALQIDAGASLPTITNSGSISATLTANTGMAAAIRDNSNTLNSVTNTGAILASNTANTARAIDVSGNTAGFTFTQQLASATATNIPGISGAIVTGSGDDHIIASAGLIQSKVSLGAGNDTIVLSGNTSASIDAVMGDGNDSISLSGTSIYLGTVDFGAGNDSLTIGTGSGFFGQIVNGGPNVAVALNGGTLAFNTTQPTTIGSLAVTGGTIGAVIDPSTGQHTVINVTGPTSITSATTLKISVVKFGETQGAYTILQSGSLTGSNKLTLAIDSLPYLLTGSLVANDAAGTVGVAVTRKTATELGFRPSEAAAYNAIFSAIESNATLSDLFLGLTDRDPALLRYREMLPDHAGGVFDVLSSGSRMLAPTESATPWAQLGRVSLWVQQGFWDAHQDGNATPGNGGTGWGLTGGGDIAIGDNSRIGASIGYIHGDVRDSGDNEVFANQFGGGVHWLSDWSNFHLGAYANAGYVRLSERRSLTALEETSPSVLISKSRWNAVNFAAGGKASYEITAGTFYLRPSAGITYNRLSEGSHSDSGGGAAFDLIVDKRTSSEFAATGMLAAGLHFGNTIDPDATTFRFELEGGRRQILSSNLDATTAHFAGGNDFTLLPEDRKSGWTGGANASLGSSSFRFIASGAIETRSDGQRVLSGRVGFRGSF